MSVKAEALKMEPELELEAKQEESQDEEEQQPQKIQRTISSNKVCGNGWNLRFEMQAIRLEGKMYCDLADC